MIQHKTAVKIAASWHGGQWSALYSFASSGQYLVEKHLQYLQEIESCLHPEYAPYPGILTKSQETELVKLRTYIDAQGWVFGILTEYSKHPDYGYNIPYLDPSTPAHLKINPLQYSL